MGLGVIFVVLIIIVITGHVMKEKSKTDAAFASPFVLRLSDHLFCTYLVAYL